MEENKNSYITYDENWQSVSESEYPVVTAPAAEDDTDYGIEEAVKKIKPDSHGQLLAAIQLAVCVIIALSAFVIKSIGGELYDEIHHWYAQQLANSAIFDGKNSFDIARLFDKATQDEV